MGTKLFWIGYYLLFCLVIISLSACGKAGYSNTPDGVVRKLLDSMQENDASKYLDSILPSDRQKQGYFFYRQLIQGVFGGLGLGQMESSKLKISFTNMSYIVLDNNGSIAHVKVDGNLRDLNLAIEQPFSTIITTENVNGIWLVSVEGDSGIVSTPASAVALGKRDAIPPKTPEQVAAANAFEQWAQENNLLYDNARYETTSNDNSFATVLITFTEYNNSSIPIEAVATVNLRYIGGEWKADERTISIQTTQKGQATLDAITQATQIASSQQASSTAKAINAILGGTIAFIAPAQNSNAIQIGIRNVDGTINQFDPLSAFSDYKNLDALTLSQNANDIYFSAERGDFEPGVFRTHIDGINTSKLKSFGGQSFINTIVVSSDNNKIAFIVSSFLSYPNEIWVLSADGGTGKMVWNDNTRQPANIAWNSDSNSLIVLFYPNGDDKTYRFARIDLSGNVSDITQLPVNHQGQNIIEKAFSISPDGKDLVLGWGALGLLHLENGNYATLLQNELVCNPKWVQDNNRSQIVFASGNNIFIYNVKTGSLVNVWSIPNNNLNYSGCPQGFDWVP